jgi:hypothetical protein
MTTRRLLALAALLPVAALVAATSPAPVSARAALDGADRCSQRTPIPASAVAAASRLGCPLVGRVVTDGRISVRVPPPGMSVAGEGVGKHGDVRGLRVTNTGTAVRVVREGGGSLATVPQRAGNPPACKDRAFHLEGHKWKKSLSYHVNLAKMPGRFAKKTVIHQIQVANGNMRKGRNTCGKPRLKTPASHYLGTTAKKANISPSGPSCGRSNGTNIVAFGNLPGGLLGWTCYWYIGGRMVGTDMMIDNGRSLTTKLPKSCSNLWDFEGTVTHEWGHSYGLAHTGNGHSHLTMQHLLTPCSTYARTLGLGDWLGMKKLYGARRA